MFKTVVFLLLVSATALAQDSTTYAELPRFNQVSEKLFRGAQPLDGGISKLHELGINTVINLRGASDRTRAEEAEVRALGLNYFNIALPNWARPQNDRVARIMELIDAPESGRVFIHCKAGVDRTGLIVAIYRMTHDGWSSDRALAEAQRFGMRRTQFWMRDYAEDYGDRVRKMGAERALKSPHVDEDLDDRIGNSMRVVERGAFRAQRAAARFLQKFSASFR
jgi:protein tyrosine/serine phosphatase